MKMFDQVDILKYVQRRASKGVAKRIKRKASTDAAFKAELELMKSIFAESSNLKEFKVFDLDNEWSQFTDSFLSTDTAVKTSSEAKLIPLNSIRTKKRKSRNWMSALAIAASLLLLVTVSFFLDQFQTDQVVLTPVTTPVKEPIKTVIEDDIMVNIAASSEYEVVETELPDGTLVKLNPNAKITYAKDFETAPERVVYLEGVAFFDVETDKKRKFVIKDYASLGVEVLGTSFTVEVYPDGQAEIRNKEGRVKGFKVDKPEVNVLLVAGEIATYNGSSFTKIEPLTPEEDFRQPIDYIINNIVKGYGYKVSIAPGANISKDSIDYKHTVLPLESILMILNNKINLEIERDGKSIIIKNATLN